MEKAAAVITPFHRPGSGGVQRALFRSGKPRITLLWLNLFSTSMLTGALPVQQKVSTIVPILINKPVHDPQNYRPVNQTPILTRLMERMAKDQLVDFLTTKELISEFQHGFLKRRFCLVPLCFFNPVTLNFD